MAKKASSFQRYNQAAVLDILVRVLPEIARAVSEPLSKTDRITMISTDGAGPSRLTADVAKVMAELPAIVESLSGIDLKKVVAAVPGLKEAMASPPEEKDAPGAGPKPRTSAATSES